jgi:hypothetical protein
MLNKISIDIRNIFINSMIYRLLTKEKSSYLKFFEFSLIKRTEDIIQRILKLLHPLYCKGVQGSIALKIEANIKKDNKRSIMELITFAIIGTVLAFNLFGFINKNIYVFQLYISAVILILATNIYFMDIYNLYKNSLIKKIVDSFFEFE